ncbi:MAG: hypothetical protein Q7U16_01740 [Agitococcus sp.]|nr:hypothetical protein [Agitococcus sp.]
MKKKDTAPFHISMRFFGFFVFFFGLFFQDDGFLEVGGYDVSKPAITMWVGVVVFSTGALFGLLAVVAARVNAKNAAESPASAT